MLKYITYPFMFLLYPVLGTIITLFFYILSVVVAFIWDYKEVKNACKWSEMTKNLTDCIHGDWNPRYTVVRRFRKMNGWYEIK